MTGAGDVVLMPRALVGQGLYPSIDDDWWICIRGGPVPASWPPSGPNAPPGPPGRIAPSGQISGGGGRSPKPCRDLLRRLPIVRIYEQSYVLVAADLGERHHVNLARQPGQRLGTGIVEMQILDQ